MDKKFEEKLRSICFKMYVSALKKLRDLQKSIANLSAVKEENSNDFAYAIDVIMDQVYKPYVDDLYKRNEQINILSEHYSYPIRDNAEYFVLIDPVDGSRELMRDERAAWLIFAYGKWKGKETKLKDIQGVILGRLPPSREHIYEFILASETTEPLVYKFDLTTLRGRNIENLEEWEVEELKNRGLNDIDHSHICFVAPFPPYKHVAEIADNFWNAVGNKVIFNEQYLTTAGQMLAMLEGKISLIVDIRKIIKNRYGVDMLCAHPYDVPAAYILKKLGAIVTGKDMKEESFWNQPLIPLNTDMEFIAFPNKEMFNKYAEILKNAINK